MKSLRFTLVTDGTSDGKMLLPILEWLLQLHCRDGHFSVEYSDPTKTRVVPRSLVAKIKFALSAYPCQCLFVHRDAEREESESRRREILEAIESIDSQDPLVYLCIVPIRMTEAWLLLEEAAIRRAAGNPRGRIPLKLPKASDLECIPDPKTLLHDLLVNATELPGRRRKSFNPRIQTHRLAQLIDDFSPLRQLTAFQSLEQDVETFMCDRAPKWQ